MLLLLVACVGDVSLGDAPAAAPPDPSAADHAPAAPAWTVDCAGGGDFETLADAVDAAANGDTIAVAPCTYAEALDFGGKTLWIESTGGPDVTVLDAPGGVAVRAGSGEGPGTALVGFTVTGGGDADSGAVEVDLAALRLEDVVLTGNRGLAPVYVHSGDAELVGVEISGNRSTYGVGILQSKGSLELVDSTLACDGATYGLYLGHGSALIDGTTIDCSGAYAAYWEHEVGRIQRSVVDGAIGILSEDDHYDDFLHVWNSVVTGGIAAEYGSLDVRNAVVYGGIVLTQAFTYTVVEGSVIADATCGIRTDAALLTVRNNAFWDVGSAACGLDTDPVGVDGNFSGDPLFVDAAGGDWSLAAGSPCVDAGPPDNGYEDVDGTRNDVGAYGGPFSLGGGW